ncbi:hypothetical protein Mkiyose1665_50120 [Mycobacterium kiyosense]|nr:hypothetical protein MKCMC460_61810 [Mycobacterium sp. 20KCMC460]GLB93030.1 hypothetical protein SRL2020130_58470 [Mycobacterium kiyosense]GLB99215.1 hypothetical protein SRL2020226_59910 [Mycobacterium kiyosense]GLC04145.1 hypothetical protein SRL2020400_47360 [Mycobacterium kiyosense]GLC11017.1 hypothetical protein SRL2020411_56630 [Mycobacterium kiyosense]
MPGNCDQMRAKFKTAGPISNGRGRIAKMVDEDKCCNNVLTQIGAASSALRPVAPKLLDDHLNDRVSEAVARGGKEANVKLSEAPAALARLVRS